MAKTHAKRRRTEERQQLRTLQRQQEWERSVLEAAEASLPERSRHGRIMLGAFLLGLAALVVAGFIFAPGQLQGGVDTSLWLVLLTGLTTGGLSCLAVQGGLLATTIAQREELDLHEQEALVDGAGTAIESSQNAGRPDEFALAVAHQRQILMHQQALHHNMAPVFWFLVAKLAAYTLLGVGLGWLGSQLKLNPGTQAILQIATALFMLATALHLLKVHPIFRYVILQPPRFITRRIRNTARSKDIFAPGILGAMTIFMPCAITQAMQLVAINSGSPLRGGAIMFTFVLGTSPLFFALGAFATRLGDALHEKFLKFAAVAVLLLAVMTMETGLKLAGSPYSLSTGVTAVIASTKPVPATIAADGVQEARIDVEGRSYNPGKVSIKAGKKSRVVFITDETNGCTLVTVFQGVAKQLPTSGETVIDLPARAVGEDIDYTCGMGMYSGSIKVV